MTVRSFKGAGEVSIFGGSPKEALPGAKKGGDAFEKLLGKTIADVPARSSTGTPKGREQVMSHPSLRPTSNPLAKTNAEPTPGAPVQKDGAKLAEAQAELESAIVTDQHGQSPFARKGGRNAGRRPHSESAAAAGQKQRPTSKDLPERDEVAKEQGTLALLPAANLELRVPAKPVSGQNVAPPEQRPGTHGEKKLAGAKVAVPASSSLPASGGSTVPTFESSTRAPSKLPSAGKSVATKQGTVAAPPAFELESAPARESEAGPELSSASGGSEMSGADKKRPAAPAVAKRPSVSALPVTPPGKQALGESDQSASDARPQPRPTVGMSPAPSPKGGPEELSVQGPSIANKEGAAHPSDRSGEKQTSRADVRGHSSAQRVDDAEDALGLGARHKSGANGMTDVRGTAVGQDTVAVAAHPSMKAPSVEAASGRALRVEASSSEVPLRGTEETLLTAGASREAGVEVATHAQPPHLSNEFFSLLNPQSVSFPADAAGTRIESAPLMPVPPPEAELMQVQGSLTSHSAHLQLDSSQLGISSVHLRLHEGSADVRLVGANAEQLRPLEPELRLALAHEGLSLGNLDLGSGQDRPSSRDPEPNAPSSRTAPRPTSSSTLSGPQTQRSETLLHVKA